MAAKRAKKAKKNRKARRAVAKARRPKAAKRPAKAKSAKRAKPPVRKAKAKKARAATAKRRRKDAIGEGSYTATRAFDKAQSDFVKKNRSRIPEMGKEAEQALEGPQGDELRQAEEDAKSHTHDQAAE